MIIKEVDVSLLDVDYRAPLHTSIGSLTAARNVVVRITADSGISGWGEAAPFGPVTGDSQESCYRFACAAAKSLIGTDPLAIRLRNAQLAALSAGEISARAAIDIALHDLASRHAQLPLFAYLGGARRPLSTDCTIGILPSVAATIDAGSELVARGFRAIKVKAGRAGVEDAAHVLALREALGPDIELRVDANQAWDLRAARANLETMRSAGIAFAEQPLPAFDVVNLAFLRRDGAAAICADESMFDAHDAFAILREGAADYLNIKLGKCAGIAGGLDIAAIAAAAGARCMIGCYTESRLGLAAAAHLAMARPAISFLDLDSAFSFRTDPLLEGPDFGEQAGGCIELSAEPGLGCRIDEARLRERRSFS
nr:dipeptide epimerase [Sphingomonas sp. Y57]